MTARHTAINYAYADLPKGGEVRISTSDPAALKAVHDFLAAQGSEHHVMP